MAKQKFSDYAGHTCYYGFSTDLLCYEKSGTWNLASWVLEQLKTKDLKEIRKY